MRVRMSGNYASVCLLARSTYEPGALDIEACMRRMQYSKFLLYMMCGMSVQQPRARMSP